MISFLALGLVIISEVRLSAIAKVVPGIGKGVAIIANSKTTDAIIVKRRFLLLFKELIFSKGII
jgi:hypothetical protein